MRASLFEQYKLEPSTCAGTATLRCLLVGGSPVPSDAGLLSSLAQQCSMTIAIDRGVGYCRTAGIVPQVLVGDLDTAEPSDVAWAQEHGVELVVSNPEKDDTDLALALNYLRKHVRENLLLPTPKSQQLSTPESQQLPEPESQQLPAPKDANDEKTPIVQLVLSCVSGGCVDHQLGVIGLIAHAADLHPIIIEDGSIARVLSERSSSRWQLGSWAHDARFSLIALSNDAQVSERGTHWELDHKELAALSDLGISNRVAHTDAYVEVHRGVVLVSVHKALL